MWKDKWKANYKNEGDLQELPNFVKKVGFGAKLEAQYLGWAVVDRHFSMQDGTYELLKDSNGSVVEVDEVILRTTVDQETGEIRTVTSKAFFVNVKASWEGREHIERYPIQNSNGIALQTFTQNDLNTSYQRAKTKAIAIVSGIGYWLYEGQGIDADQYEKEADQKAKVETKVDTKVETKVTPVKRKSKEEKKQEQEETTNELFSDKKDDVEVIEVGDEIDFNEGDNNEELTDEKRSEYDSAIKSAYLGDPEKTEVIKTFLKEIGKTKFNDFTDAEYTRLYNMIK